MAKDDEKKGLINVTGVDVGGVTGVDVSGFSDVASKLVDRVFDSLGGMAAPIQMKRMAKAEVAARKIRAIGDAEVTEIALRAEIAQEGLIQRAMQRLAAEEIRNQANIESITVQAIPDLRKDARPESITDDWMANFLDKGRLISDEEMQALWARVLAGEGNTPGSFSKRTVNLLAELDAADAILFGELCRFCFEVNSGHRPLILRMNDPIYLQHHLGWTELAHLSSIGLVNVAISTNMIETSMKSFSVSYFGQVVGMEFGTERPKYALDLGHAMLTQAGEQLFRISAPKPVPGFLDFVVDYWSTHYGDLKFERL